MPEAGVGFFGTFILALVIGVLLATAGQLMLAMIVFGVAIISVLSMLFTPSPAAKARRAASEASPEEDEEGEVEDEGQEEATPSDLKVDTAAAPTTARRAVPAPPPEPPPMVDVVATTKDEDEANAGDEEDVWVE